MTEALARASDPEAIEQEALDALVPALAADRAAILFDHEGVLRFTAWRGLSDTYRAATEGHSPWSPDDPEPEPVLVPDIDAEPEPGPPPRREHRPGHPCLGLRPLISGGRFLGKFMVYFDQPHSYSQREVEVAQAIAAQVAFAIDKRRLESQLRPVNEALTATLDLLGRYQRLPDPSRKALSWLSCSAARRSSSPT